MEVGKIYTKDLSKMAGNKALGRALAKKAAIQFGKDLVRGALPLAAYAVADFGAQKALERGEREVNPLRQATADMVSRSVMRGKERQAEASARKPARNSGGR